MRALIVLALCVATAYASGYGYSQPEIRINTEAPPLPVTKASYGGYEAPAARTTPYPRMHIPIVKLVQNNDNAGKYDSDFESAHGIKQTEQGSLKDLGDKEGAVNIKSGSYSYTGPDNVVYRVQWTADERGFLASGAHFPTPHPIPEEIQKSLEQNRLEEEQLAREGKLPAESERAQAGYGYSAPAYAAPAPVRSSYSSYSAPEVRTTLPPPPPRAYAPYSPPQVRTTLPPVRISYSAPTSAPAVRY